MIIKVDSKNGAVQVEFDKDSDLMMWVEDGRLIIEDLNCEVKPTIVEESLYVEVTDEDFK